MIFYQNQEELVSHLYHVFLGTMAVRGIDPYSGSGNKIVPLLEDRTSAELHSGKIASEYDLLSKVDHGHQNLQAIEDNLVILANALADDAVERKESALHEWSLSNVKKRLCPLYPFFREPCSQYDPLVEP